MGREEAAVIMRWELWEGGNGGGDRWRAKEEVWLGARKAVQVAQRRERQERRRRRRVVWEKKEESRILLLVPLLLVLLMLLLLLLLSLLLLTPACLDVSVLAIAGGGAGVMVLRVV